ncbi:MAG: NAD-dependent epimerase/dehydratase family protein [Candidatus Helarchaeota archaeon]|nr:NAD-dependent epimerase/dehydratase family protein [Candidatus Helarchaeota archaeon]
MIVAITGICSGLGRALVPKLQDDKLVEKIIGIDIVDYEGNSEKIEFIKMDVRDAEIARALKSVDILFHLAFIVIPKKFPKLKEIYEINVNGSKNVFQAAAQNEVKKIIYISSQAVYGHVPECPKIVRENAPRLGIKTKNLYYSHTKALVEKYLDKFEKTYPNISVIRFRPPVITGINFMPNLRIFSLVGKKRTIFPVKRKQRPSFQLIHEDDLTDALMLAVKKDIRGAFNVGGRILPDLRSFLKQRFDISIIPIPNFLLHFLLPLGKIWPILSWVQALKHSSLLNVEKAEKELGWKAKYSTAQCIEKLK